MKVEIIMKNKMKILSPAGDMLSIKMAVYNGADEVYLGLKNFNARNNIEGFDITTLKNAVDFAHIYGVKVHLAINILFTDSELQPALDILIDAYNLGVDAFIIQDLGLMALVHKHYPQIELHASTQMGIHNLEGVQYLSQFGVKRVVLARETPLSEIKRIKQYSDVELEYFAQGALCVCFSGNCYLSSYECNASGNRGKCKQLCRLPYTLTHNGKDIKSGYLLSAKDFCMIDKLDILCNAGIDAIKIEGRARRPYYVASTTHEYRKAIDGKDYQMQNIKLAFNRLYTHGYFDGNSNIISPYNNHIGIFAGIINKVNYGKKFNEFCFKSKLDISPKSTLKLFADDMEKCTISPYDIKHEKDLYKVTTTQNISVNDKIYLLSDNKSEELATNHIVKRKINIDLELKENAPIYAKTNVLGQNITINGDICQVAQNQPISLKNIKESFEKSDYFEPYLTVKMDNVFLPIKQLNEFRRKVYEKVINILTSTHTPLEKVKIDLHDNVKSFENFEIVKDTNSNFKNKNVIYSPSEYTLSDIQHFCDKCKKQGRVPFLNTPNFLLESDITLLRDIIENTGIGIVSNNYCTLLLSNNVIVGSGLNIYNHESANTIGYPYFVAESNIAKRVKMPYMTLRHCPMKEHLNCDCNTCKYDDGFVYTMQSGKIMKLRRIKMSSCTFYLED